MELEVPSNDNAERLMVRVSSITAVVAPRQLPAGAREGGQARLGSACILPRPIKAVIQVIIWRHQEPGFS
jgi:hypothetical protein